MIGSSFQNTNLYKCKECVIINREYSCKMSCRKSKVHPRLQCELDKVTSPSLLSAHVLVILDHILFLFLCIITSATEGDEPMDDKAPSMGAKSLCIPFKQPEGGVKEGAQCFACEKKAVSYTLWGRSY